MQLALYFSHIEDLQRVEDALEPVDLSEIESPTEEIVFFSTPQGNEYLGNLTSLNRLHQCFGPEPSIERLYFGQEFCQFLLPGTDELRRAYYFSRQLGWDFTYLTPGAITDAGVETLREHFRFLADEAPGTEVVANSWGVLRVLSREFGELRPVLGRLLNKQMRLPQDPETCPPRNLDGIRAEDPTIMENQTRALRGLSLSLPPFRRDIAGLGVDRFEIDIVPQGVDIPPDRWGLGASCYYPWTYVTSGRNCLTAAEDQPDREFVVPDRPCSRPCRRLSASTNLSDVKSPLLERGNTIFMFNDAFARPYLSGDVPVDRIVYTPYAPI